jgi:hypothetical protein
VTQFPAKPAQDDANDKENRQLTRGVRQVFWSDRKEGELRWEEIYHACSAKKRGE